MPESRLSWRRLGAGNDPAANNRVRILLVAWFTIVGVAVLVAIFLSNIGSASR